MSASRTEPVLGLSLLASDGPRDYGKLVEVILAFYEQAAARPVWFTALTRSGKVRQRAFESSRLRENVLDPSVLSVHVGTDKQSATEHVLGCFLRPRDAENQEFETRWISLTATGLNGNEGCVLNLTKSIVALYPIAQGAIAGYRSLAYAAKECSLSGAVSSLELDIPTRERLGKDQMLAGRLLRQVRRLYSRTLIGTGIWSELPPMPRSVARPPLTDIGDCKLVTAWPVLVEPRDPDFLAGTVELRRWLWPCSIQNPHDAVDVNAS